MILKQVKTGVLSCLGKMLQKIVLRITKERIMGGKSVLCVSCTEAPAPFPPPCDSCTDTVSVCENKAVIFKS